MGNIRRRKRNKKKLPDGPRFKSRENWYALGILIIVLIFMFGLATQGEFGSGAGAGRSISY